MYKIFLALIPSLLIACNNDKDTVVGVVDDTSTGSDSGHADEIGRAHV